MNIIVGQSGGPTAAINSSLFGVIKAGKEKENIEHVYGMLNGIEGLLQKRIVCLEKLSHEELKLLQNTPSSYLGSCRYKMSEDSSNPVYEKLFAILKEFKIEEFYYIGGNDSMDTIAKCSKYAREHQIDIRFIGVPKTIDNDLVGTDHTPGYGSTAKYVACEVRNIIWDAGVYQQPVVTIIELMGRDAGWITASSILARTPYEKNPLLIYLPEVPFTIEKFVSDVKKALSIQNSVVVCVSEGIKDENGQLVARSQAKDNFGHTMLSGAGKILEGIIKQQIGCKCRSIEVNLLQRCSNLLQSLTDIEEAERAGEYAVHHAENGKVVCLVREKEYEITYAMKDVNGIANLEKRVPKDWIINGNDLSQDFIDYVYPLIQGETRLSYQDGLPILLRPAYKL